MNNWSLFGLFSALSLSCGSAYAADPAIERWLPHALAPAGEWGAALNLELELRDLGSGEEQQARRFQLRMGWTPISDLALWVEAGVGNLTLSQSVAKLQGDYGAAAGLGAEYRLSKWRLRDWQPYIYGHANQFISRLEDNYEVRTNIFKYRRSRFDWLMVYGQFGVYKPMWGGLVSLAGAGRELWQNEAREVRTSSNTTIDRRNLDYVSGLEPGVSGTYTRLLKNRVTASLTAEVYPASGRISLSIGQWGVPQLR